MGFFKRHGRDDEAEAAAPVAPPSPAPPSAPPSAPAPPAGPAPGGFDLDEMMRQAAQLSGAVRQQGLSAGNVEDLTKFALAAQAQAQAQMEAVQQAEASGGGIGAIMSALGMRYSSDYVKRAECPSCGAPKKLPSDSAYLYCDYCGALADYDFRRACEDSASALPGPEYAQLVNSSQAELRAALAAGDKERYRATQMRIYDAYASACPKALSHRIGDPDYRARIVAYMAEMAVVNDFDSAYAALMDEMRERVAALQWTGGLMARRTGGPTFRALVDVCKRQAARANELAAAADLGELDPDHCSNAVKERMYCSLFSQGWLPMLEADDAGWLIGELNLGGEYMKAEVVSDAEDRHCGICGGDVKVLPGAKTVVCRCGRALDVGGAQAACRNCGGAITFPVGVPRLQCPYCHSETERVGWT